MLALLALLALLARWHRVFAPPNGFLKENFNPKTGFYGRN